MTLTVRDIIDGARGHHASFDESRHPTRLLRTEMVVTFPLADHEAGIALDANRQVDEVVAKDSAGAEYPVDLIPARQRLDRGIRAASCWQIGQTLYLTSPSTLWARMTSLGIALVPVAANLSAPSDTIPLPDICDAALQAHLALFMAVRHPGGEPVPNVKTFHELAKDAEDTLLDDFVTGQAGQIIRTRDVYGP